MTHHSSMTTTGENYKHHKLINNKKALSQFDKKAILAYECSVAPYKINDYFWGFESNNYSCQKLWVHFVVKYTFK